ncbi:hypothetical protein GM182_04870 [bacterium 3DAC]|jgi:hypothetical protein|nr:hypothetical protein [Dictyoglomota bacterium]UZN23219.1 hypothetical protein GM182_04870 [bacterium 3DAC]
MHHEVIAKLQRGQGIEGILVEDGKIVMRWNISAKKTTPVREVLRAIELAEAGDYVLVEIKMEKELYNAVPYVEDALDAYGVDINLLSEDT